MSQKNEKHSRFVERSLGGLEERMGRLEAGQTDQRDLILRALHERTAEQEIASWNLRFARRRAREAERRAELWRCVALAAVLAILVLCLAVVLWNPSGAETEAETVTEAPETETETGTETGTETEEISPVLLVETLPNLPTVTKEPGPEVHVIEDCVVSYYCCEKYPHICGTGDGITATGTEARPWITCAVDPRVIPLGSRVTVDIGNGESMECVAEDVGQWVEGNHIDICVPGHQEALELGIRRAEVRWEAAA